MAALVQILLFVGIMVGIAYSKDLDFNLITSVSSNKPIEVTWMDSLGLLCDTGVNGDKIAKVVCGQNGGSAVSVTNPAYDVDSLPEFSISNMTCAGTEGSLTDCDWGLNHIVGFDDCTTFVGANCTEKTEVKSRSIWQILGELLEG